MSSLSVILDLNYYWTVWFDRDSPSENGDDDESLERIHLERPHEVCEYPLYMQAVTRDGVNIILHVFCKFRFGPVTDSASKPLHMRYIAGGPGAYPGGGGHGAAPSPQTNAQNFCGVKVIYV